MFNDDVNGIPTIDRFIDSSRPVRVWYNKAWASVDGTIQASGGSALIRVAGSSAPSAPNGWNPAQAAPEMTSYPALAGASQHRAYGAIHRVGT